MTDPADDPLTSQAAEPTDKPHALPPDRNGSVRDVLRVAFPLIMASSSHALKLFTDRIMLAQYSSAALAASLAAGLMNFTVMSPIFGTANYTSSFVAQYVGAGRKDRVGRVVWQGIFIGLSGGVLLMSGVFWGGPLFRWIGHDPQVVVEEIAYFRILIGGCILPLALAAVHTFWSGRGKTWTVFAVEGITVVLNIILNYLLIFGTPDWLRGSGIPTWEPMGITGAGIATVVSTAVGLCIALALFLLPRHRQEFGTLSSARIDVPLMRRLVRFGLPNGLHILLDIGAFNMFTIILGWQGATVQEATTIAFSMNAIAFIPMIGLGHSISILVGQAVGARVIAIARRTTWSGLKLVLLYMGVLGALFVIFPEWFVGLFQRDESQQEALTLAMRLLRYIAAYLLFDGVFIIYNSAIKGAGDTAFAMRMGVLMAWVCMVVPCLIAYWLDAPPTTLYAIFVVYVTLSSFVFYARYRGGRWESMRVIEH